MRHGALAHHWIGARGQPRQAGGDEQDYRSGKDKLFAFFVGQAMKASGGKLNPGQLNELLKKKLK